MTNAVQLKEITKDELNKKIQSKDPFELVNVLAPESYKLGVIKGSKKIPGAELEARFRELDKKKAVVTYCAGASCEASIKAAELLSAKGYDVSIYKGGVAEWSAAGLPLEAPVDRAEAKKEKGDCCS